MGSIRTRVIFKAIISVQSFWLIRVRASDKVTFRSLGAASQAALRFCTVADLEKPNTTSGFISLGVIPKA